MSFVSIVVPLVLFLRLFGHFSDSIDCGNLSVLCLLLIPKMLFSFNLLFC